MGSCLDFGSGLDLIVFRLLTPSIFLGSSQLPRQPGSPMERFVGVVDLLVDLLLEEEGRLRGS